MRIVRRLEEAGFSTWAVGGAVRDALAERQPGDWDLATAARPGDVRHLFRRTVPVGIEHGTVGILGKDGVLYEVTTFRRDVETDGRHARVVFAETVDEDLARRDFTINAVAWHPLTGEVHDPHGGVADLRTRTLRTVGPPAERFREDRLRVLRALRFAGRFGLTIEPATWEALCATTPDLGDLSAERIREELRKTLGEVTRPSDALQLYAESGALRVWYPELQSCVGAPGPGAGDVWTHLLRTTAAIPCSRVTLRLTALLHDVGRPSAPEDHAQVGAALAGVLLRRLRASNAETDRVMHLVAQHASFPDPSAANAELRRWLRGIGRAYFADLVRLRIADVRARGGDPKGLARLVCRARRLLRENVPLELGELAIGGRDLMKLGIPPGPRIGEMLRELLERVLDDPALNTPEALTRIVREELS